MAHSLSTDPRPARSDRAGAVGIVSSAGGPQALLEILPRLVPLYPVPIIIAQHSGRASLMADLLRLKCGIEAKWVRDGELPQPGQIHLVPPGTSLRSRQAG